MTRDEFAKPYLVALYREHRRDPSQRPSIEQLISSYDLPRDDYLEGELYEHLKVHGWAIANSVSSTVQNAPLKISFAGKAQAERWIDRGIDPALREAVAVDALSLPASDRLVRLDHNSAPFVEIRIGLEEMREAVRGKNDPDADVEERSRLLSSLTAASALWESAQLKAIQVKIGIVMAIEDAGKFLVTTSKVVAAALLVDTVKALVKSHTGIDLDKI